VIVKEIVTVLVVRVNEYFKGYVPANFNTVRRSSRSKTLTVARMLATHTEVARPLRESEDRGVVVITHLEEVLKKPKAK
jgi:hypothetical protein